MGSDKYRKRRSRIKQSKPLGLIGCGTPAIALKAAVTRQLASIDGVFGSEIQPERIVLRIRDEQVIEEIKKVTPNMKFGGFPIETVVIGLVEKHDEQQ
jgi:hypothetical protein